jgi:hypothetical protein
MFFVKTGTYIAKYTALHAKQTERLGLQIRPKYWHLSSKLHSITCQKDLMFVSAALKSSNLIQIFKSCPRLLLFQMAHLYAGYSHLPCLRVFLYSLLCLHVQSQVSLRNYLH